MCKAYGWEIGKFCKCIWYTKEPELCANFISACQNQGITYNFEKTLCPVKAPHQRAFCTVITVNDGQPLVIVGIEQDSARRPYRMSCSDFEGLTSDRERDECPLHGSGANRTVRQLGQLTEIPWENVDIIGHQLTPEGGIQYLRWERNGGKRKWVTEASCDADNALGTLVNAYHAKKKGLGPRNQPWPMRWEPTWHIRLGRLRQDPPRSKLDAQEGLPPPENA